MKKLVIILVMCVASQLTKAQDTLKRTFTFQEFLGYVKAEHPLVKQANLAIKVGEASILKARGGFDPKVEVDYNRKKFKESTYYDQLNATFKIPTWYGVEFKANFEENSGAFLNPNLTVPQNGLYSAGISLSLARGFLINERMAALKKAKFFNQQTQIERDLLVNKIIFEATKAYFEWVEAYNEKAIYENFLKNGIERLEGVKKSVEAGDKAAIDSLEANITVENRRLGLEAAALKQRKAALVVSNFLWIDEIPLELEDNIEPVMPEVRVLNNSLNINLDDSDSLLVQSHPKLLSLEFKQKGLRVDKNLKLNKLLPKLDVQYNFLASDFQPLNIYNTSNYKAFVNFSVPLFLRKERGDLKLARIKLQDNNLERISTSLTIKNKIEAVRREIQSLDKQYDLIAKIASDYEVLLKAEERKFALGESSIFLVNTRERSLITSQLKMNTIAVKQLKVNAKYYNALGLTLNQN